MEGGRERERHTHRERQRETETETERDRQRQRQRQRQIETDRDRERQREINSHLGDGAVAHRPLLSEEVGARSVGREALRHLIPRDNPSCEVRDRVSE